MEAGIPLAKGRLTIAFANVEAFGTFDLMDPNRSRFVDEDMNRVWSDSALKSDRDTIEIRRARQLLPFVDAADFLLDIHSMHEACRPIMVCGTSEKSVAFARKLGVPGDLLLDTGHPNGLRMIERGDFSNPNSPRVAILIECGQHWEGSSVHVAIDTIARFLEATGVVDPEWARKLHRVSAPETQRLVRASLPVVAESMDFRFTEDFRGLEVLPCGALIATDGQREWRAPHDDCVLVMPSLAQLQPGVTMVRLARFVD
jgi:predicted deacylase